MILEKESLSNRPKLAEQAAIDAQISEFLARGGQIKQAEKGIVKCLEWSRSKKTDVVDSSTIWHERQAVVDALTTHKIHINQLARACCIGAEGMKKYLVGNVYPRKSAQDRILSELVKLIKSV